MQAKKKLNNLCDLKKAGQCAWLSFLVLRETIISVNMKKYKTYRITIAL